MKNSAEKKEAVQEKEKDVCAGRGEKEQRRKEKGGCAGRGEKEERRKKKCGAKGHDLDAGTQNRPFKHMHQAISDTILFLCQECQ